MTLVSYNSKDKMRKTENKFNKNNKKNLFINTLKTSEDHSETFDLMLYEG